MRVYPKRRSVDVSVFGVGIGVDTGQVFVQFFYGGPRSQHFKCSFNGIFGLF